MNERNREVVVGEGRLNLVEFLRTLKEINFNGYLSLEYESAPEDPVPPMRKCLEAVRNALEKIG